MSPMMARRTSVLREGWPGFFFAASVLVGAVVLGLIHTSDRARAYDAVGRLGGFVLDRVTISGQRETSDSAIVAAMGFEPGVTLLGLDVEEARRRLERLPWIKSATVRKILPSELSVTVAEAEPYARWRDGADERLIAKDGRVLADVVPFRYRDLPLVAGRNANERALEAVALLLGHGDIAGRTRARLLINGRRWDLLLVGGARIKLPEANHADALDRLMRLEGAGLPTGERVVVDLRVPDRTVIALKPPANDAPETLFDGGGDPLADMIARGQRYDDPLARAIAEAML